MQSQAIGEFGPAVFRCISGNPNLSPNIVLSLQMELEPDQELPVILFLSVIWQSIWNSRVKSQRPSTYKVRADLEAKVNLLSETRWYKNVAVKISQLMNNL